MAKQKQTEQRLNVDAMMARLRTFVETFEAMDDENERRAALYYLTARVYGNDVGDRVLQAIR